MKSPPHAPKLLKNEGAFLKYFSLTGGILRKLLITFSCSSIKSEKFSKSGHFNISSVSAEKKLIKSGDLSFHGTSLFLLWNPAFYSDEQIKAAR